MNNTVIRVLPRNSVTDVVFTFGEPENIIRNNIFVVHAHVQVFSDNGTQVWGIGAHYTSQIHDHNLYFSEDKSETDPIGIPPGLHEIVADPRFVNFATRELRLRPDSPAIHPGVLTSDSSTLIGSRIESASAPDLGAFQSTPAKPKPSSPESR